MKQKIFLLALGVFFGITTATFWLVSKNLNTETIEHGRKLQNSRKIEEFQLVDYNGNPFTKENLLGRWNIVTFGFTSCPDVCPTALAAFRDEIRILEESQERMQFIFISVDPERDSQSVLKKYISYFHPNIVGLTGTLKSLEAVASNFGVHFQKTGQEENYSMAHSPQFFLIDPQGQLAAMYSPPLARGKIAMDLTRIAERNSL